VTGLRIEGVCVDRAGSPVVHDVDLEVAAGEVTVLLGANGVGKSTLLDGVAGVAPVRSGRVFLDGADICSRSRRRRVRAGLAYVQQGREVFGDLTVEENLLVAAPRRRIGMAFELFPELRPRAAVAASLLSGGEQQMLVLARALLGSPRVLMIDELSLGLAPVVVDRVMATVTELAANGLGVLLVEQFADRALAVGQQAAVLARGRIVLRGPAAEIRRRPDQLQAAYLGGETEKLTSPSTETPRPEPEHRSGLDQQITDSQHD